MTCQPVPVAKLAIAFARMAARGGWREAVLDRFCEGRGIAKVERLQMWPRGIRSVSWDLNAAADREMIALHRGREPSVEEVILTRLGRNRPLKRAVTRLAWCDFLHPIDTLRRTHVTAGVMLECSGAADGRGRRRLTVAYCLIVLVWLADRSAEERITRRSVPLLLRMFRAD